jgi:glycosyltransferase involved in cell wall biosynthesis
MEIPDYPSLEKSNMVTPTVSVVVPCRNEKDHIHACLRSILAQELSPEDFEIIVADGMSDDETRDILEQLAAEDPRSMLRITFASVWRFSGKPAQTTWAGPRGRSAEVICSLLSVLLTIRPLRSVGRAFTRLSMRARWTRSHMAAGRARSLTRSGFSMKSSSATRMMNLTYG